MLNPPIVAAIEYASVQELDRWQLVTLGKLQKPINAPKSTPTTASASAKNKRGTPKRKAPAKC
jgi:hypothetical protein